jgi:hypothetical protein
MSEVRTWRICQVTVDEPNSNVYELYSKQVLEHVHVTVCEDQRTVIWSLRDYTLSVHVGRISGMIIIPNLLPQLKSISMVLFDPSFCTITFIRATDIAMRVPGLVNRDEVNFDLESGQIRAGTKQIPSKHTNHALSWSIAGKI